MYNTIKGFKFIDGSTEGFSIDSITNYDKCTLYFIRTDADGEKGFLYINGKKYGQNKASIESAADYTTFEALEDTTFTFTKNLHGDDMQYSLDNGNTWTSLPSGTATPTIHEGEKVMWKGTYTTENNSEATPGIGTFTSTGKCNLSGNALSLVYGDDFENHDTLPNVNGILACLFSNLEANEQCKIVDAYNFKLTSPTVPSYGYSYMFYRNGDLVVAPDVKAETIGDLGCFDMFSICSNLVIAPKLTAVNLGTNAYGEMFAYCTRMIASSELPSTNFGIGCYASMFANCSGLVTAPKLNSTTLSESCYVSMFSGCTNLKIAPNLPATTLAEGCYGEMFISCKNLIAPPKLYAKVLTEYCYAGMFANCTSLTTAPKLPATTLVNGCYHEMFSGCTSLNNIKMLATDIPYDSCLENWVDKVASKGTFLKDFELSLPYIGPSGIPNGWEIQTNIKEKHLTFIPIEDTTFTFTNVGFSSDIEYSLDDGLTWTSLPSGTETPTIQAGYKIIWKATKQQNQLRAGTFSSTKNFNAYGNVNSIVYGNFFDIIPNYKDDYAFDSLFANSLITNTNNLILPNYNLGKYCYQKMFLNCKKLVSVPSLPADTLGEGSYYAMFSGCTSLTTAPELPATTLDKSCYQNMFNNCTNLREFRKELPATTLAESCYQYMFSGCTNLEKAPYILPSVNLSADCYKGMFMGCENLTTTPELPATILTNYCYSGMFHTCSKLTSTPKLPAKTLGKYCYENMFKNCSNITEAPELPATTLTKGCYMKMFENCYHLTTAPNLPSIQLADECYFSMFSGCTRLTTAPKLPATTLADSCYYNMFNSCTSLTTAPELPATKLTNYCYQNMFTYCISLNHVTLLATDVSATNCLYEWLSIVAEEGTMIKPKNLVLKNGGSGIPLNWNTLNYEEVCNHLMYTTFEALEDGTFSFTKNGTGDDIQYSKDNGTTWTPLASGETVSVVTGDKVMWKSSIKPNSSGIGQFKSTANFNVYGNILSLLNGDRFDGITSIEKYPRAFSGLFSYNTYLIDSSRLLLPLETLSNSCYEAMFANCTNLTTAPSILPATTLVGGCYAYMFFNCTNLTTAPELPATTLADGCYDKMFRNCTSLTTAPELPATTLAQSCYNYMFDGCTNLMTAPKLPATTLAQSCYTYMFSKCTSLTTPPELPSTTLANRCYVAMFEACTSLTIAPELPATTLVDSCYNMMFNGCANLSHITMLATDISVGNCFNLWVQNISPTGTFIKHPDMNSLPTGGNGIPEGWSVFDDTYENKYLTFEVLEDSEFGIIDNEFEGMQYSTDNGTTWSTLNNGETTQTIKAGGKVLWKGYITPLSSIGTFTATGKFNVYGNVTSLRLSDNFRNGNYTIIQKIAGLRFLFTNNHHIIDAANMILPINTMYASCYESMFSGCTSLTTAPELPATELASNCYRNMFSGCKKLNHITMLATDITATNCLYNWVTNVSESGTFVKDESCYGIEYGNSGIPSGWTVNNANGTEYTPLINIPLTFIAIETGTFSNNASDYLYSVDNGTTWSTLTAGTQTPTISAGNKVMWKAVSTNTNWKGVFDSTGKYKVIGNIMSLLFNSGFEEKKHLIGYDGLFYGLFAYSEGLTDASDMLLPATTLCKNAYAGMFVKCTNMTKAPKLPALELGVNCYASMFSGCTSLTTAPELPSINLKENCYMNMFDSCTKLTNAPILKAHLLADRCYEYMFSGCNKLNSIKMYALVLGEDSLSNWLDGVASSGIFTKHTDMTTLPSGTSGIPSGWTIYSENV